MHGDPLRNVIFGLWYLHLYFVIPIKSDCTVTNRTEAVLCNDVKDFTSGKNVSKVWKKLILTRCAPSELNTLVPPDAGVDLKRLELRSCEADVITSNDFSSLPALTDITLVSAHFQRAENPLFCKDYVGVLNLTIVDSIIGNHDSKFIRNTISLCKKLKHLTLSQLDITNVGESDFVNASSLIYLDLSRNSIRMVESKSFRDLTKLQFLSLFDNQLSFLHKEVFVGPSSLRILRLDQNNLNTLPDNVFDALKNLKELILSGNSLQQMKKLVFSNMNSLEKISLAENDLKNFDQHIFFSFVKLQVLELSGNNIEEVGVDLFMGLSNLEFLYLDKNEIKNIQPRAFDPLASMICLNLSKNSLETLSGDPFTANNSALKTLDLSVNNMRNLQPRSFINLLGLDVLNLANNHLESFAADHFGRRASLERLDLSHNQLSITGGEIRVSDLHLEDNYLSVPPEGWLGSRLRKLSLRHNPWQCACLRAMQQRLRSNNVRILNPPPLDGRQPVCVVLKVNECILDPHALPGYKEAVDAFKEVDFSYVFSQAN